MRRLRRPRGRSSGLPAKMRIECVPNGPFMVNTYIVGCEETNTAVLVDPGHDVDVIAHAIDGTGLTITAIVNTHGHLDHLAGVTYFQKGLGVPFKMHPGDAFLLDDLNKAAAAFGLPRTDRPRVDDWLEPGAVLEIGEERCSVIHAPGHSPGGVMLDFGTEMLTGDVIFEGSIGRTDLPGGDYTTLLESIRNHVLSREDAVILHPGHGSSTTVGRERRTNPFLLR